LRLLLSCYEVVTIDVALYLNRRHAPQEANEDTLDSQTNLSANW
jgi:hypothetical protein